MPKMKSNKAARKRFKVTAKGKVLSSGSLRRHMLADRSPKKKRQARGWQGLEKVDGKRVKRLLPYGK